jgi:hypothetical protein
MKYKIIFPVLAAALSGNAFCQSMNAHFKFEINFTDHEFECAYGNKLINVGVDSGGDSDAYSYAKNNGLPLPDYSNDLQVYVQKEHMNHKTYGDVFGFWGEAKFGYADKIVTVKQINGHSAYFERFGSIPAWPYKSKKDSQYFFSLKIDDGPVYKCKAIPNADE